MLPRRTIVAQVSGMGYDALDATRTGADWLAGRILPVALPADDWAFLEQSGRPISVAKGEVIFSRGATGETVYLIRSGRVEISITLADGQKAILNEMGPGEVLGEIAVLDGGLRTADASAASAQVELVAIAKSQVFSVLEASHEATVALIRELCKRVRNASDMFEVKSEKSARVRLARSLLRLAAKWGTADSSQTVIRGFSQGELGELAGLARENVNRQLKLWVIEGLIRVDGAAIILLDPDAIADQALL